MIIKTNEIICKVGSVELNNERIEKIINSGGYIVSFRTVYKLHYSKNAGYYGTKIFYADKNNYPLPLTKRGRFIAACSVDVNRLIGFKLLND